MGAICFPKLMERMDGFFGCKVVVNEVGGSSHGFSFEKKTLFDLIKDFFSNADDLRRTRATTLQALKAISGHLGAAPNRLDALVGKYEFEKVDIDFREVRRVLLNSLPLDAIEFSPMVYSRNNSVDENLWRDWEYHPSQTVEKPGYVEITPRASPGLSSPMYRSAHISDYHEIDAEFAVERLAGARPVDDLPADDSEISSSKISKEKGCGWPARQDFKTIYLERINAIVREKNYKVEIWRDPDGVISDENLAALAETMVEIERSTKTPLSVSDDGHDDEEFRVLSGRLDSAFVDYIAEHGNPYAREPADDIEKVKAKISELQRQYGNAPLRL